MSTSKTPAQKTIAPFKSDRAAKQAMTRAEKAYVDARCVANCAYREAMENPAIESPLEYQAEKQAEADRAWEYAQAVYNQARSQGFWVKSWHFGPNPTRDLIAANMD